MKKTYYFKVQAYIKADKFRRKYGFLNMLGYGVYAAIDDSDKIYANNFTFYEQAGIRKEPSTYIIQENFQPEDVVVFGDDYNDLDMFDDAFYKIAMGNGCDALKERADYVTETNVNDGIYQACKHHQWI